MGQHTYPSTPKLFRSDHNPGNYGIWAPKNTSKESSYSKRHMETLRKHVIKRDRQGNRGWVPQTPGSCGELRHCVGRDTREVCDSLFSHRLPSHLSQAWGFSPRLQETQGLCIQLAWQYFISLNVISFPHASFSPVHIKDGSLWKSTERSSGWALVIIFDSTKTTYEKGFFFAFYFSPPWETEDNVPSNACLIEQQRLALSQHCTSCAFGGVLFLFQEKKRKWAIPEGKGLNACSGCTMKKRDCHCQRVFHCSGLSEKP